MFLSLQDHVRMPADLLNGILWSYAFFGLPLLIAGLAYGALSRWVGRSLLTLPAAPLIGFLLGEGWYHLLDDSSRYRMVMGDIGAITLGVCAIALEALWLVQALAGRRRGRQSGISPGNPGLEDGVAIKFVFGMAIVLLVLLSGFGVVELLGSRTSYLSDLLVEDLPFILVGVLLLALGWGWRQRWRWHLMLGGVTLALGAEVSAFAEALSSI
jgi:hypothetical protein